MQKGPESVKVKGEGSPILDTGVWPEPLTSIKLLYLVSYLLCCPHMWSRNKINSVLATKMQMTLKHF